MESPARDRVWGRSQGKQSPWDLRHAVFIPSSHRAVPIQTSPGASTHQNLSSFSRLPLLLPGRRKEHQRIMKSHHSVPGHLL